MALVIKSWSVNSSPPTGQPHIRIVGRESGLISFILSLLGIDATTTLLVNERHIEHERGDLSGFRRDVTPVEHISTTYYGRFKPWKKASIGAGLGVALLFSGGWFGVLLGLIVIGLAGFFYVLNRTLTLGYVADSGLEPKALVFKRSVIEGQEINEDSLRDIIAVIEHLIKPALGVVPIVSGGGRPASDRVAGPAPTSIKDLVTPGMSAKCPSCRATVLPEEVFCGTCGHKVR